MTSNNFFFQSKNIIQMSIFITEILSICPLFFFSFIVERSLLGKYLEYFEKYTKNSISVTFITVASKSSSRLINWLSKTMGNHFLNQFSFFITINSFFNFSVSYLCLFSIKILRLKLFKMDERTLGLYTFFFVSYRKRLINFC